MDNKDLIELSKKVSKFVIGFEGNVSKKENDVLTIKASGKKLSEITSKDFVSYNSKLKQINNFELRGSMELDFHNFILNYYDCQYVCHTHPTNVLKILSSKNVDEFINNRIFPDQVVFNGSKYCFVPYVHPGVKLKSLIESKINEWSSIYNDSPKVILLQNHGIITFGKSIDECVIKTEICEKSAEIFLGAKTLGDVNFLSEKNINELINDEKEKLRLKNL
jgi:rhamnose utilization protein RhaD (predicted bifunctional aldolase and dehydrogenase)